MKITLNQPPYNSAKSTYKLADERLDVWVDEGNYAPALELLENLKKSSPHRNADNFDYCIWIYSQLKQYDNKMRELLDAARNDVFFPLEEEGYFEGIHQHVDFEPLRQKNLIKLDELRQAATPELEIYTPDGNANGELLLILHGNRQYIESIAEQWPPNPYLEQGYAVAYLQSPQLFCSDGYVWTEHYPENRDVIEQAFELIKAECKIDQTNISIAGFSGGAMVSMSAVTHGTIKPKQVLAFMPHNGDFVGNFSNSETPICIFKAEFDQNIDDLYAALNRYNLKQIMLEGISHALPADMASYVLPYLNKSD